MSDTAEPAIAIGQQCMAVLREIRMREKVYPRLVARNQMSQPAADMEIAAMRAVLATLREIARAQNPQTELLG